MMQRDVIDIHSHLNLPQFDADREEAYARMREEDVSTITVGVDLASSRSALEFARMHEGVWACVGVHPADDVSVERFDEATFGALADDAKVVAIGECGLDYYRGADEKEKARQRGVFEAQIAFAIARDLPLMLHGRPTKGTMDAYEDMLEVLRASAHPKLRGNAHFFVGTEVIARGFWDIGFSTSYPGIITFVRDFDAVIRMAPPELLHAETDAPFAAPEPCRGKRNEPAYVVHVVGKLAEIRGVSAEDMATTLRANAKRLFNI